MTEETIRIILVAVGVGVIVRVSIILVRMGKKFYVSKYGDRDRVIADGKRAFLNDLSINDNPYTDNEMVYYKAWVNGWELSKKARMKLKISAL